MKKTVIALAFMCSIANAANVTGEGEYRFGPETAENVACQIARDRAEENAIANFVGEYIEHSTDEVCKDNHCTQYKQFYSETYGQIRSITNVKRMVAPDRNASVCIVSLNAEVKKIDNYIRLSVKGKNQFKSGEKFNFGMVSNYQGNYAVFSFVNDTYTLVANNKVVEVMKEIRVPAVGKFEAYIEPNVYQSNELMVVLFTRDELTYQPRYSKIEFEHMVKQIDFTRRKPVNHQINIVR